MDRAEVKVELNRRTQKHRLRCQVCMKVAYPTDVEAKHAADTIKERGGPEMRYYINEDCGWWHVTRVKGDGDSG